MAATLELAGESILALQDFSDFLYRGHFIPKPVDVRAWIDERPFAAASQSRFVA